MAAAPTGARRPDAGTRATAPRAAGSGRRAPSVRHARPCPSCPCGPSRSGCGRCARTATPSWSSSRPSRSRWPSRCCAAVYPPSARPWRSRTPSSAPRASPRSAGGVVALAEELLPRLRVAEWLDRAEAALNDLDELDLRDLRSVVVASDDPAVARDESTRDMAAPPEGRPVQPAGQGAPGLARRHRRRPRRRPGGAGAAAVVAPAQGGRAVPARAGGPAGAGQRRRRSPRTRRATAGSRSSKPSPTPPCTVPSCRRAVPDRRPTSCGQRCKRLAGLRARGGQAFGIEPPAPGTRAPRPPRRPPARKPDRPKPPPPPPPVATAPTTEPPVAVEAPPGRRGDRWPRRSRSPPEPRRASERDGESSRRRASARVERATPRWRRVNGGPPCREPSTEVSVEADASPVDAMHAEERQPA